MPKSSKKKKKKKKENKKEGDSDSDDEGLGIVPSDGGVRLGNKGGVGIALCIGSTSMLFVGAHLAATSRRTSGLGRRSLLSSAR